MIIEDRPYQIEAENSVFDYWEQGGGNPLAEMATGTGKSVVIGRIAKRLLTDYEGVRVLILTHVRELVSQNAQALLRVWPGAPIGINSAGLGKRDRYSPILFASVQSVFNMGDQLGPRDVVMVDECDRIPADGEGMYRTLLDKLRVERPDLRVCGFTATPYRLDYGRIDEGKGRLFDKTVYCYDLAKAVQDGYLSPLKAKATKSEIDVSGVKRRGGEFVAGSLEEAADKDEIIKAAVEETIALGADRLGWLMFCSGVKHAEHVCTALRERGISAATITHKTPSGERDRIFKAFKAQQIKALTGMDVFTTGFDAPHVDLIGLLRPTLSTRLYVQMLGRGTRLCGGKSDCLVLDFAGNVRRHGPVDDVEVKTNKKKDGEKPEKTEPDTVRAKICPVHSCHTYNSISAPICVACGFVWPKDSPPKHDATADTAPVMKRDVSKWTMLTDTKLDRWQKFGEGKDSMVVDYEHARGSYRQWICWEHTGFARERAEFWWITLGGQRPPPATINEALQRASELHMPVGVYAKKKTDSKFHEIKEILAERPDGSLIEIDQDRWKVKPHKPEVVS